MRHSESGIKSMFRGTHESQHDRRGAVHVLVAAMMMVFIIAAALTVDVSYMQLIRTELRTATDAAAKAGTEALIRTQDQATAKAEAVRYAGLNNVGGSPFVITENDVHLGRVVPGSGGKWTFQEGGTPLNAVRVDGNVGGGATTAAKPLFFGPALGVADFSTSHKSTAAKQEVEICLCLDRSGSMLWDMSGTDSSYTTPNPNLSTFSAWGTNWQYALSPPHPSGSRWAVLGNAIDLFLDEASKYRLRPRTALVTWGTDYTMPIAPGTVYGAAEVDVNLPWYSGFDWEVNKTSIEAAIDVRTANPMMGGTNMSAGIDEAVGVLTGPRSQVFTTKIMILLSDGQWNAGRDPLLAAADANAAGVTIHTISMLSIDTWTLQQIANATDGDFYQANDEATLRAAFEEIARSLPIVFTE
jgi:Ca-activated chloride channel family protein